MIGWLRWFVLLFLVVPNLALCGELQLFLSAESAVPKLSWEILDTYPHDPSAFTEGLFLEDGILYESTGLYGESSLRKVELRTGKILEVLHLEDEYFAEGIAPWGDTIVQLTWTSRVAFVYDRKTLERLRVQPYPYDGWGITACEEGLIVSDGSETLRFLDPENFTKRREIKVKVGARAVDQLNELEYAEGRIYANVWHEDLIVVIDPQSGCLMGWVDLADLKDPGKGGENVLNGIAYDSQSKTFLVTGKRWHYIYRIKIQI